MRHAIEKSCNVYFYTLGNMLGVDRIHEWAEKLGMSGKTGIDLPNEVESLVPSTEWKKQKTGEKWYAGETISVAIGQGQTSITPTSLAVMMATLANGGTRVVPHLVKAVDEGKGWEPVPPAPSPFKPFFFKPGTISAIHDGLWMAVNEAGHGRTRTHSGPRRRGQNGCRTGDFHSRQATRRTHRQRLARSRLVRLHGAA